MGRALALILGAVAVIVTIEIVVWLAAILKEIP